MKKTEYFDIARRRRGRAAIRESWITRVVAHPEHERKQADGRIRRWARIEEAGGRWLRVIVDENTQIDLDEKGNLCGLTLEHASERADLSGIDYQQVTA